MSDQLCPGGLSGLVTGNHAARLHGL